jgi:hypothetical protein
MATDNFNRANGGLGANWGEITTAGGFGELTISSNVVGGGTAGADQGSASRYTAVSFTNDQYSQVTVQGFGFFGSAYQVGTICRSSADQDGAADYYYARVEDQATNPKTWRVGKNVNGTFTSLADTTRTTNAGDVIKLEVIGSALKVYQNGTLVSALNVTDTDRTTGNPGAYATGGGGPSIDNWEGNDVVAGAHPVLGRRLYIT